MSGGIEEMFREAGETAMYKHYKKVTPEPIDVIEGWGLGFNLGNAIKYIGRSPYKDQRRSDLEKAIWYLQRELDLFKD